MLSAIMLTGHQPERRRFALQAIECFRNQTLASQYRELVIINAGESFNLKDKNIVEHLYVPDASTTVGGLRNLGLELAKGDWIIQWDDDDWHHPERCNIQLEAATDDISTCVLLQSQIRYDLIENNYNVASFSGGIVSTILHSRAVPWRYALVSMSEDHDFCEKFRSRIFIKNRPLLYCRFYHGLNTCAQSHVMTTGYSGKTLTRHSSRWLRESILKYYLADHSIDITRDS